jgi:transposase
VGDYSEAFVAFDTSKLRNAVAIAEAGRSGEVRFLGEIENTAAATGKLVRKLAGKYDRLAFCYEAGPTGYGLYRRIAGLGHECLVVAPSLIPKKAGDRVKTNRRDALGMVKQFRAGELTAVWVPDPRHEAMRDLTRPVWRRWRICAPSASRCRRCCCGSACIIRAPRRGRGPT